MIIDIDKTKIFVSDAGKSFDKNKHTIILIHGSGLSHIVWSLSVQYLSNQNYNVLALDSLVVKANIDINKIFKKFCIL